MKRLLITIALLIAAPALAFDIPTLKGRVNDNAGLLSSQQIGLLTNRLKDIEASSGDGSQVVVLTVPSLDGESIDDVRNKVFHDWKLGQIGHDNGVLIVIAPVERKIGIEVGYGLEPYLPDGVTKQIIDDRMKPFLKKGSEDWFKALDTGASAVGAAIAGREKNVSDLKKSSLKKFSVGVIILGLVGAGGLYILFAWRRQLRREAEGKRILADAARRRTYREGPAYPATPPDGSLRRARAAALGAGLGAGVAASPRAKPSPPARSRSDDAPSRSSSSDYSSGSSWGGSSSSDSGSSFSGGGGDSGGGGSSGDF